MPALITKLSSIARTSQVLPIRGATAAEDVVANMPGLVRWVKARPLDANGVKYVYREGGSFGRLLMSDLSVGPHLNYRTAGSDVPSVTSDAGIGGVEFTGDIDQWLAPNDVTVGALDISNIAATGYSCLLVIKNRPGSAGAAHVVMGPGPTASLTDLGVSPAFNIGYAATGDTDRFYLRAFVRHNAVAQLDANLAADLTSLRGIFLATVSGAGAAKIYKNGGTAIASGTIAVPVLTGGSFQFGRRALQNPGVTNPSFVLNEAALFMVDLGNPTYDVQREAMFSALAAYYPI